MPNRGLKIWRAAAGVLAVLLAGAGCDLTSGSAGHFALVIGSSGHTAGKFNRPRGIGYDPANSIIYVVDWDGRVQKFSTNGQFRASWIMPDVAVGKPEDVCMALNGNVLIADTHYNRIMEFTPEGMQVRSFGSYGKGAGQFIYPVALCRDSRGDIYVSEYGEIDRIQKFTPDGKYITQWGGLGTAPGQFQRPSGMAFTTNDILYVTDAVNHRIQVFDTEGRLLKIFGQEGDGPGEFRYPYDLAIIRDDLYVLEYGNHRVQKLTLDGKPLGMVGRRGTGDGCFVFPWRLESVENSLYVSDTDNGRVVRLDLVM